MIILYFGDIFAKPGRRAVASVLPRLKKEYSPDFIVGNAENLAGGRGINRRTFHELLDLGFHGFTSGNHVWDNKEVLTLLDSDPRIFRPANYPSPAWDPCPGKGHGILRNGNRELFMVNLLGRVYMDAIDCPFQTVDRILKENTSSAPIFVDMHADATSEKYSMGFFLDGKVSAVVGSHSHVQTADERILPGGTAYITDVGLTGSLNSVIGLGKDEIIRRFITKRPQHFQTATENLWACCVVIRLNEKGKADSIERLRVPIDAEISNQVVQEKDME